MTFKYPSEEHERKAKEAYQNHLANIAAFEEAFEEYMVNTISALSQEDYDRIHKGKTK